ncbi:MAG: ferritin-like domain-containing protein [Candidatus Methylomirabilis sp.]|nr:ferritin-like domain-containing protein [Deltaproteobacteria bacterium]
MPTQALPLHAIDRTEQLRTSFETTYTWDYQTGRADLRTLYEKAKRGQWNAALDMAWATDVDPEAELVPDMNIPIYGTRLWDRLTKREIERLRHENLSWTLSQFLHGEQGALLVSAQVVDATPEIDAKLYGATQVMDEGRHVEVYERYLREKLQKTYGINQHLKTLIDAILTDTRWDFKYLGMQIMVEGLALAAFRTIHQLTSEPLLRDITEHVIGDEARHVAFGVMALRGLYGDMPEAHRREREEFLYEGCRLMRDRLIAEDVWETMGLPVAECVELALASDLMKEFRRMLFSRIVPNVKRLGLLSPWLRERFSELEILQFEDFPADA